MPKTYIVNLGPEDVAIIKSASGTLKRRVTPDPKNQVDVTGYASAAVKPYPAEQVTCAGEVSPPPGTDPPPDGTVNRLPGLRGPDLLSKAEQSPEKYWDVHAPRPVGPPGTEDQWLYQMDLSDDYHISPWSDKLPSTAWFRVETLFGMPAHSIVRLKWPVAHHMTAAGKLHFKAEGRNDPSGPYTQLKDQIEITGGTPGDKRLRYAPVVDIPVQNGGFKQYRITATGTIAHKDDAGVFGAPDLSLH